MDPRAEPDDLPLPDPDDQPAELMPAAQTTHLPAAGVVVELLRQSQRDAAAGRAQAGELVRALDRLEQSQEYLGTSLRGERRKGRWLVAALLAAPFVGAAAVWALWGRVDDLRGSLDRQMSALRTAQESDRLEVLETAQRERVAALKDRVDLSTGELAATREELGDVRSALVASHDREAEEQTAAAARERELLERITRLERDHGALSGLRAQVRQLRERAGTEATRADALEREIRELERRLQTPAPRAAPAAIGTGERADGDRPAEARPEPEPLASHGAVRNPADLAPIRRKLNSLLAQSVGEVTYRVQNLGGVAGHELLDVTVRGVRADGSVVRTIKAARARVEVNSAGGNVVMQFFDGELLRGGRRAPFFQGRYGLVLDTDVSLWAKSGLNCVAYH